MNETMGNPAEQDAVNHENINSADETTLPVARENTLPDTVPQTRPAEEADAHAPFVRRQSEEELEKRERVRQKINALDVGYHKKPFYDFVKRAIDIVLSFTGLLVLAPVYLVIAILIKCDDGGQVFYRHKRLGRNGKVIYIHKFRSMKKNADHLIEQLTPEQLQQYYTEFKIDNDPRITKIGNFLRRTSLDELPQVFDILTGKLSIIGPRPLVDVETEEYFDKRDVFLSVKPGLTGYWQAYARNNVGYSDGARQEMELHYVENRSLWFDIKIFFKTIFSVLNRKGAK